MSNKDELRIEPILGGEVFKPIPGYEGLYSISNKGNIRSDKFPGRTKKYTTTAQNQHVVVLYKNATPSAHTVESLFNLAWKQKPFAPSRFHKTRAVCIECLDDPERVKKFKSIKECCIALRIDYKKLQTESKIAENVPFICNGHKFRRVT